MCVGKQWGIEQAAEGGLPKGCELVRLTDSARAGGYACHMYLNVPTFTADGRQLVFVSTRGSQPSADLPGQNLFTCDLDTGRIVQVTDLPDACMHRGWFDPKSGWHYFWRHDSRLSRASLATGQVEDICRETGILAQRSMIGLTCDGRHVVYAVCEDDQMQAGPPIYTLYRIDLHTRRRHRILSAGFRISHVQCSPTNPDFILYNWECMTAARKHYVPVMMRMWWCNLAGTAGGPFGNQRCNEGRTHEFFSSDGRFVGYHGALHDPAGPPTDESVCAFTFGLVNASDAKDSRQMVLDKAIGHSQLSSDGKLIVCDRCGDQHVGLVLDGDRPRYQPIWAHGSSWIGQNTHPHPQFRPGTRQVVLSTDRAMIGGVQGRSDIYLLTLPQSAGLA